MTEALLSSVLDRSNFILHQDLTSDVVSQLKNITDALMIIQTVIQDAEMKQSIDRKVFLWVQRVKEVAYDIEDILDEWSTYILTRRQQNEEHNSLVAAIKKMICCRLISTRDRRRRLNTIKAITVRLKFITRESLELELNHTRARIMNQRAAETTRVSSLIPDHDSIKYGIIHSDKENIVHRLVKDSLEQQTETGGLYVLCIVGMGGIGKTTLAQLIINDDRVRSHFDFTTWVCIGDGFDPIRIAREINFRGDWDDGYVDHENPLYQLSRYVNGKRFLLVLDDVWNEDMTNWNLLYQCLAKGAKGSSILVTTRKESVASIMSTTTLYRPQSLTEEDSWLMARDIALKGRDNQELEDIGKAIVQRCRGIPLAVKAIAGLLRNKNSHEWMSVLEHFKQPLEYLSPILPVLELSYNDLPSTLKQCFAYTAIFPKDYMIEKDMLIKLWMAQGFLGSSARSTDLERIGEEYFNELVELSFLQNLTKDKDGKVTHCTIHDLLHDLASMISKESIIMGVYMTELISGNVRHLSVEDTDLESVLHSVCHAKNLSTLLHFGCTWGSKTISPGLFNHLRCLRALELSFQGIEHIPDEVGRLMHLRYLDLSSTNLKRLPDSVCDLYNLQTLKLNECRELCELPKQMKILINLRHLEIQYTPKLCYLPQGISRLSSLRTLSKFTMSGIKGECKIGELNDLHELRGKIEIRGLCKVESLAEANEAGLRNKEYLCELIFNSFPNELENIEGGVVGRMESVLESLQPHQNLEKLAIRHCHVSKYPSWLVSGSIMCILCILIIHDCKECIELPAFGKLPSLRELRLQKMGALEHIGNGFYEVRGGNGVQVAFPKLEELHIVDMPNLEHWDLIVQDEKSMPQLCDLFLQDCPKLMSLPHVFSDTLKYLTTKDCPKLPSSALEKLQLQGVKLVPPMSPPATESPKTSSTPSGSQF